MAEPTLVHAHALTVGDFIDFPDGYGEVTALGDRISGHIRVNGVVDGRPVSYYLRRYSQVRSYSTQDQPLHDGSEGPPRDG